MLQASLKGENATRGLVNAQNVKADASTHLASRLGANPRRGTTAPPPQPPPPLGVIEGACASQAVARLGFVCEEEHTPRTDMRTLMVGASRHQLARWGAAVDRAPGCLAGQSGWAQARTMANVRAPARRTRGALPVSQAMAQAAERHLRRLEQRVDSDPVSRGRVTSPTPLSGSVAGATVGAVAGLLMYVLWHHARDTPAPVCIVPSMRLTPARSRIRLVPWCL